MSNSEKWKSAMADRLQQARKARLVGESVRMRTGEDIKLRTRSNDFLKNVFKENTNSRGNSMNGNFGASKTHSNSEFLVDATRGYSNNWTTQQLYKGDTLGQNTMPDNGYRGNKNMPARGYQGNKNMPARGYQGNTNMPARGYQGNNNMPARGHQNNTNMPNRGYQGNNAFPEHRSEDVEYKGLGHPTRSPQFRGAGNNELPQNTRLLQRGQMPQVELSEMMSSEEQDDTLKLPSLTPARQQQQQQESSCPRRAARSTAEPTSLPGISAGQNMVGAKRQKSYSMKEQKDQFKSTVRGQMISIPGRKF